LPGRKVTVGHPHILTSVIEEIEDLFIGLGYEIKEGPEVETDYYNFEALNLPKGHPAREMQDSFYITNELLLRTHTSPVQARTMRELDGNQPIRMICPGKVIVVIVMMQHIHINLRKSKDYMLIKMFG